MRYYQVKDGEWRLAVNPGYDISQTYDGEWRTPPRKNFYRACCDCGLVHREEYRVRNGRVQYRVWRDKAETRRERKRRRPK